MTDREQINAAASTRYTLEEYLALECEEVYEWVEGELVPMPAVHDRHDDLINYLRQLLNAYFALRPIGFTRGEAFVMILPERDRVRVPDLQVVLNSNPNYTPTALRGPADIVIEVVSPESVERDHGTKFKEYEAAGVPEYWIIDPLRREVRFYQLDDDGIFQRQLEANDGNYTTEQLPEFVLHVPTLWRAPLPNVVQIVDNMRRMLNED
jgi:Uma2 family endonuclease